MELRNVIKQPLTADELRALAARVGDAQLLVAPKRRGDAAGLDGEALIQWLAADGARLRKPLIDIGNIVVLGFDAKAKAALGA